MPSLATAYVDIVANKAPLTAGLNNVRSDLTRFVGEANRIMSGLMMPLGIAGAGGIGAGLFKAAKMAADLEETVSKVQVTFGKSAQRMIDQADDLAERFGVVKQSTLDASSMFGILAKTAGMSTDAAAKFGKEFVDIGIDLASFYHIARGEVFEKMLSGLEGMPRPLREVGIFLSDSKVQAEALAMGLIKVKRNLTDEEKIIVRANLIRKQAVISAGDAERTAMSTARQLEKAIGDATNTFVEFGDKLKPSLIEAIGLMRDLGKAFRDVFGKEPDKAIAGGLKRGFESLRDIVKKTPGDIKAIKGAWEWLNKPISLLPPSLRPEPEFEGEGEGGTFKAENEPDAAKIMRSVRKVKTTIEDFALKYIDAWDTITEQEGVREVGKILHIARKGITAGIENFGKSIGLAGRGLAYMPEFFSAIKPNRQQAFEQVAGNPMLQFLGLAQPLAIGGAAAGGAVANVRKRMEPGESQVFTEAGQYAQYAQQKALENNLQKEQVQILEAADKKLGEVSDTLKQMWEHAKSGLKATIPVIPRAIGR